MRNKCWVERRLAIIKTRNPPIIFGRIAQLTVKKNACFGTITLQFRVSIVDNHL
jgi:hypothetical protein